MEGTRAGVQNGRQDRADPEYHAIGHWQTGALDDGRGAGRLHSSGESAEAGPPLATQRECAALPSPAACEYMPMTLPAGWEGSQHNFLGLEEPWCHPDQAGVYVLPAPYEHTSSYMPGSDEGPSAIIEASHQVEFYDEMLRCEPFREWGGIATVAPLDLKGKVDGAAVEAIEAFVEPYVAKGRFVVTLT